jgi:hypothetical protein
MIRSRRIKAAVAAVTVTGATTAAMLIPSSPAVAFSSGGLVLDVVVQSPAHLVAKGAAVGVPVEYTCSGTTFASLSVTVTEKVSGGAIASGRGEAESLTCTGEIQSTTIDVVASGSRAFVKGAAFAQGDISGCGVSFCGDQLDQVTIDIQK